MESRVGLLERSSDWDWMAIGQQYGLPTRLLDWTDNPLVACFFATNEASGEDSAIHAYQNESYIEAEKQPDPFEYFDSSNDQ